MSQLGLGWPSSVVSVSSSFATPVDAGIVGFVKRRAKALPGSLLSASAVSTLPECCFPCWRYCRAVS
jgi:hypothetical protein